MDTYLNFAVDKYSILINSLDVIEILENSDSKENDKESISSRCRLWRGEKLPVIDINSIFIESEDLHNIKGTGIVCSINETRVILCVDQVLELLHLDENDFTLMPIISEKTFEYFDKAYIRKSDNKQLLRLKQPLPFKINCI